MAALGGTKYLHKKVSDQIISIKKFLHLYLNMSKYSKYKGGKFQNLFIDFEIPAFVSGQI